MKKFFAAIAMIAAMAMAAPAMAATNPFMDVPQGHWAYDAVALLASRGIVSGYPDGAFKGPQPATRYEVASVVARALVTIDAEKASKQDLELLKKLVMEFKDELDALGVKVDKIDKRVAVLEDGIGGWKIRGTFRFDAKFTGGGDDGTYNYTTNDEKYEFSKEQFRLFLTKTIDENTYFYAQYRTGGHAAGGTGRGDLQHMRWSHLYVNTMLPYDVNLTVGRFAVDFEGDYGLYTDQDAWFGDYRADGFKAKKSWGNFTASAVIARNAGFNVRTYNDEGDLEWSGDNGKYMTYALDLNYTAEKFFIGATGYWFNNDNRGGGDYNVDTYGFYAGYRFTPAVALKGIYYTQSGGDDIKFIKQQVLGTSSSSKAWKLILDVKQEALKFTSLWLEYGQRDNAFIGIHDSYGLAGSAFASIGDNIYYSDHEKTSKVFFAQAKQKWNDKWSTFLRYGQWGYDTAWLDSAKEWGLGIGYQYTPAIYFELAYDQVDYGNGDRFKGMADAPFYGKDQMVRFRTNVNF